MYERAELENGDYASTRDLIRKKTNGAVLNLLCLAFLIFWIEFYFRGEPTAPIYFAEKCWMLAWVISQAFGYLTLLLTGWYAIRKPMVCLNHQWQKRAFYLYNFFVGLQMLVFVSVLFIDLFQYVFIWCGMEFQGGRPTDNEDSLDIIARLSQVICLTVCFCIGSLLWKQRKLKMAKQREVNRLMNQYNKTKKTTWSDIKTSARPSESTECSICLLDYEDDDLVMQLVCHSSHCFHRECLGRYLNEFRKNASESKIPKCPLC